MKTTYRINNDLSELNTLLDQLQLLERKWSLSKKTSAEINLVLDELLTNIIKHSDCDKNLPIVITLTKTDLHLTIQIVDTGLPFDPTLCKLPDTSLPLEKRECGGLGVLLIRQFSDCWNYTRSKNKNILTLQKFFPKECR
ncbi:MAG: ATP-binding protein [Desulfobulbaceae bacterium]|nr:ATP-binding protein [Desulfobulbaceae bacterium]